MRNEVLHWCNCPVVFLGLMWTSHGHFLQEGTEFAESKGLLFMETSAKRNYQVAEVFNAVGE